MDRTIPAHVAAEIDDHLRTGTDVTAATLRVWATEMEKASQVTEVKRALWKLHGLIKAGLAAGSPPAPSLTLTTNEWNLALTGLQNLLAGGEELFTQIGELQDALLREQLAHAKHKDLLRKVAHCSDVFVNFREDIWGDLRDFYRENC